MKNECSIVRDLLPLYAERLVNEDTAAFVSGHLERCPECRKLYEAEKLPLPVNEPEPAEDCLPLRRLRKKLLTRRAQTILFTAITAAVLLISVFAVLDAPEYFPYGPDLLAVTENGNGSVSVRFDQRVTDYRCELYPDPPGEGPGRYTLEAWSSRWDRAFSGRGIQTLTLLSDGGRPRPIYYSSNNGADDTLIYGAAPEYAGTVTLPRLALGYYLLLAAGALCLLLVIRFAVRNMPRARVRTARAALLPAAYIASHLLIMGTETVSYSMQRDLGLIVMLTACVYPGLLLIHSRALLRRETGRPAETHSLKTVSPK